MTDGAEQPRVQGTDMTPSYNISSSSRIRVGIALLNGMWHQKSMHSV